MRTIGTIASIIILSLTAASILGTELGYITVKDGNQLEVAQRLFGTAFARAGAQYLVAVEPSQRAALDEAGVPFELRTVGANPKNGYLVRADHRETVRRGALGVTAALTELTGESGFYLECSPEEAQELRSSTGYFVTPVQICRIQFRLPKTTVTSGHPGRSDYPTDSLVNLVRQDSLYAYNRRLENFRSRFIGSDSIYTARDWIRNKFQSYGYAQISIPDFQMGTGWWSIPEWARTQYNVVAFKPGYAEPDKIIVIGGHYDSYDGESDPSTFAPGADDDASGVAVTLELARILADVPLRKSIMFCAFGAEEEWMWGSYDLAGDLAAAGTDVEVMYNYDMVGFTELPDYLPLNLSSGPNVIYRDLTADFAQRLTTVTPIITPDRASDHLPFEEQGWPVSFSIESQFNTIGYHTNLDITSRMNFPFVREVAKMAVASLAMVANAGAAVDKTEVADVGDGRSLRVTFGPCTAGYTYWVLYGLQAGVYTDSVRVPEGACAVDVTGLTDGVSYHCAVFGTPPGGYRSVSATDVMETPFTVPRVPSSFCTVPEGRSIDLYWRPNRELDISSYNLYRRLESEHRDDLYASGILDTLYRDALVAPGVGYIYRVAAVDRDGHESALSSEINAYPATFDGGILVVDEFTQDYSYMADEWHQAAYFDTILGFRLHGLTRVDSLEARLEKGTAARYSSIIWNDDDFFNKQLNDNRSAVGWYLSHDVNMFVSGTKTIQRWSPATPVPGSHLLFNEFMISGYDYNSSAVFNGATGINGWPSVEWGVSRGWRYATEIPSLTVRPGATVILTYKAQPPDPRFDGKPCGVAYDGPNGKRVIVSFPLYYLTPSSATALMTKVQEYFGELVETFPPGDNNRSGIVDLADLTSLVSYLTTASPGLIYPNGADVNSSCVIDLSDLSALVSYLTTGSPALREGCVTP